MADVLTVRLDSFYRNVEGFGDVLGPASGLDELTDFEFRRGKQKQARITTTPCVLAQPHKLIA